MSKTYRMGFTFIELLVVTTLTAMLVLAATSLLTSSLLSGGRSTSSTAVKTNGDYALSQIEFLLRNAVDVLPNDSNQLCQANMSQIVIHSTDDGITKLTAEKDNGTWKIASNSGVYLTSDSAGLVDKDGDGKYIKFNCYQTADQVVRTVDVLFTLRKGVPGVGPIAEQIDEDFHTTVQMRSY